MASNATHRGEVLSYWIGTGTNEDSYRSALSDFSHTTGEGFSVQDRSGTPTVWYKRDGDLIPEDEYNERMAEHNKKWTDYTKARKAAQAAGDPFAWPQPGSFDAYMLGHANGYERHVPYLMDPLPNTCVNYVEAVEADFLAIDADPQMSVLWYEEIPQELV